MNLALFDFDGTITTREMFRDFMVFAVDPGRLAVGKYVFAPMVVGYKLGLVPGNLIRSSVVRFGFRGMAATTADHAGRRFALDVLRCRAPHGA